MPNNAFYSPNINKNDSINRLGNFGNIAQWRGGLSGLFQADSAKYILNNNNKFKKAISLQLVLIQQYQ
jgi:hypothetical protein